MERRATHLCEGQRLEGGHVEGVAIDDGLGGVVGEPELAEGRHGQGAGAEQPRDGRHFDGGGQHRPAGHHHQTEKVHLQHLGVRQCLPPQHRPTL